MSNEAKIKTVYKYVKFEVWGGLARRPPGGEDLPAGGQGLGKWECLNRKTGFCLGWATYYETWGQWVMEFKHECVFNSYCLMDMAHFLDQLNTPRGRRAGTNE